MVINIRQTRSGFTLVELLVVIVIISLLSALILGALRTGGIRAKEDSTRSFVVHISDSLMELFEELEDRGFTDSNNSVHGVVDGSYGIRWQIPVSYADARHLSGGNSIPPFGSTYYSYATANMSSAECLYMIMTQTGYFADFVETLHATQVADTDSNGLNEFIDPWGTPIRLGFSLPPPNDAFTIQNLPVIRSAGVDLEFGNDDDIVSIRIIDGNGIFAQ